MRGATIGFSRSIAQQPYIGGVKNAIGNDPLQYLFAGKLWESLDTGFLWWIGLVAVGAIVLTKTKFGNWIFAVGGSPSAARASGVPVARVKIILFIAVSVSGVLLAAIQVLSLGSADSFRGQGKEFEAATGAKIVVSEVPFAEIFQKIQTDWTTGTNSIDMGVFAAGWGVELAAAGLLEDLDPYVAKDAKLDLNGAIDEFESRTGFMAARGIDTKTIRFSTSFGRGLDYYTGFEFELHRKGNGAEPLVGGGRYDNLLTRLGASEPIPAVGFSMWVEALTQSGSAA